jgi:DNA repair exonuclease SbcCD ATPase subunit
MEILAELVARITADATELKKALNQTEKDLTKTGKSIEKQTTDWKKSFTDLGKSMVVAGAAITAAFGLTVKSAMEVESTKIAFKNLATQNKQSANEILTTLQKASKGTVSEYDLMLSANRAMVLGVARNTRDFEALMEVARDRAKTMGITTTQAFNDIVTGIGRGSRLILDNLGIIVNLEQANEAYAKTLNKTASELTAAERQQALLNEVLKQGQATIDKTSQETMTTSESFQALKASIGDTLAQIGSSLLPMFRKAVDSLKNIIDGIKNWSKAHPVLTKILATFTSTLGIGLTIVGSLLMVIPKLVTAFNVLKTSLLLAGGAAKALWGALLLLPAVIQTISALADSYNQTHASQDEIIAQLDEIRDRRTQEISQIQTSIKAWDGNTKAIKDSTMTLRSRLGLTVEVTKAEYEEAKAKAIQAKQTKVLDDVEKLLADSLDKVDDKTDELVDSQKELEWVTKAIANASNKQISVIQKNHSIAMKLLDIEYNKKLRNLGLEENAAVKAIQDQIDALNEQTKNEEEALEDQRYLEEKNNLEIEADKAWALAQETNDYEDYFRITRQLEELNAQHQRNLLLRQREDQIESLQDEIESLRDSYDKKREELESWYDDEKTLLDQALENEITRIEEVTQKLEEDYGIREQDTAEHIAEMQKIIDSLKGKTVDIITRYISIYGDGYNPYASEPTYEGGNTENIGGVEVPIRDWSGGLGGYIPQFANGGVVNSPTLAMIGEGGESEAIIPEHDWGKFGGITVQFSDTVFLDREDSINKLVDRLYDKINKKQRFQFGKAYSG